MKTTRNLTRLYICFIAIFFAETLSAQERSPTLSSGDSPTLNLPFDSSEVQDKEEQIQRTTTIDPNSESPVPFNIKVVSPRLSSSTFYAGNKKTSDISGDGKSVKISTNVETGKYSIAFFSKDTYLRPDTDYRITFSYKTDEMPEGSVLLILIRETGTWHKGSDIANFVTAKAAPEFTEHVLRFRTPPAPRKFSFQVHSKGPLKAEIKDLLIESGTFDDYYAAKPNAKPYAEDLGELPKGSEDFNVETPAESGSYMYYSSQDMGEDCSKFVANLNKFIKRASENGITKIVVEKGVYHVTEELPITLQSIQDLEIDFNASTLIFLRKKFNSMTLNSCERVKISNVNFDWDWDKDPLGAYVKVTGLKNTEKDNSVDLTFVDFKGEYPVYEPRISVLSAVDPQTRQIGIEDGKTFAWEMWKENAPKIKRWISDGVLRVLLSKDEASRFKKGEMYRLTHYYYDLNCVVMNSNRHLTFENVNIYSTPGFAFVVDGRQKYWQFKNVNIIPPKDDKRRAITCTADHMHIGRSQGYFKMLNCDFALGNDDCLNAHDCTVFAKKRRANSVTAMNFKNKSLIQVGDNIEIRNADYSPTGLSAKVKAINTLASGESLSEIVFDQVLPDQANDGFVLFNRDYGTRNIIIRDCVFRENRARGLLILASDVTIENTKFYHNEQGAIKLETGFTSDSWCEGYGVNNVVVRNCLFDSVNPMGAENAGKPRDIYMGVYLWSDPSIKSTKYPIISNVLFENNVFKNSTGLISYISAAGDIIFKDNTFINDMPRKNESQWRGAFYASNVNGLKIVNNTYVKSPYVKNPGLYSEAESVSGVLFAGNRIVEPSVYKSLNPDLDNARNSQENREDEVKQEPKKESSGMYTEIETDLF